MDFGARQTEAAVLSTERRLKTVYKAASKEISDKMQAWYDGHQRRETMYRQMLAEGKITQADFDAWMRGQVFQGQQWQARKQEIDQVLYNADKVAAQIVNDGKIGVFTTNANYIGYKLEENGRISTGFTLYDEQTVARLIKSNPQILPKARPGVKKDKAFSYYNRLMNTCITQGIIQGESIRDISKRIATTTGESSYKSAVRNARTSYTGAQNAGRIEGMHQAQALGIKVKKRWDAILDNKTRDAHRDLDGDIKDVDEPFVWNDLKIMFPSDPLADPSLVYNCRCAISEVNPEYPDEAEQRRDNETGEVISYMRYREWEAMKIDEAESKKEASK